MKYKLVRHSSPRPRPAAAWASCGRFRGCAWRCMSPMAWRFSSSQHPAKLKLLFF